MKKLVIEVSIRDTRKAQSSISDSPKLASRLEQTASNVWESTKHFDEWDEEDEQEMEQLYDDVVEQLHMTGVFEFECREEGV